MIGISGDTYYRKPIKEELQLKRDLELRATIEKIHLDFPGYGYRRIRHHLLRQGHRVNSKRIRRIMRTYSLFSVLKKMMRARGQAYLRIFEENNEKRAHIHGLYLTPEVLGKSLGRALADEARAGNLYAATRE